VAQDGIQYRKEYGREPFEFHKRRRSLGEQNNNQSPLNDMATTKNTFSPHIYTTDTRESESGAFREQFWKISEVTDKNFT
jgi:hypothetical protein